MAFSHHLALALGMPATRMLREMPAEEFVAWQAFHRNFPFGYDWQDVQLARLLQMIDSTKPLKRTKLPPVSDFLREPPKPLQHERRRAEARRRKA